MEIAGNVYVVTGAASGLGAGAARMLSSAGAIVVLVDVQRDAGAALAADLGQTFIECDVTSEVSASNAINAASRLGKLAGLVNCAGIALAARTVGKQHPHSLELFDRTVRINLVGTFNMLRLAAGVMVKNSPEKTGERGVIVNTASVAAYDGQIGQAAYAASKAGIVGMTLPIARDLARSGIRCMTVAPGIFGTPMLFGMPQEVQDSLVASVPFPARLGRPDDYSRLVREIISNDMLNGETIRLDGAVRLSVN
jgi:NAD(P)-dependent dehydrogenase (short-subunit alcohol dehydrogenase family)